MAERRLPKRIVVLLVVLGMSALLSLGVWAAMQGLNVGLKAYRRVGPPVSNQQPPAKYTIASSNKLTAAEFFDASQPAVLALCRAISIDDGEAIDQLLASGIDLNVRGKAGMTPLMWAYLSGRSDLFETLFKHGANPDVPLTETIQLRKHTLLEGDSILFTLVRSYKKEDFDLFFRALAHTRDPNQLDRNGDSLLSIFLFKRGETGPGGTEFYKPYLRKLIDRGVDVNGRSTSGTAPIQVAISWMPELCPILLDEGADPVPILPEIAAIRARYAKEPNPAGLERYQSTIDWLDAHGF